MSINLNVVYCQQEGENDEHFAMVICRVSYRIK